MKCLLMILASRPGSMSPSAYTECRDNFEFCEYVAEHYINIFSIFFFVFFPFLLPAPMVFLMKRPRHQSHDAGTAR